MPNYAIIVGINNYVHSQRFAALNFAKEDAESFKAALTDRKAERAFPPEFANLFNDETVSEYEPTFSNIMTRLVTVCQAAGSADHILFYFAGHGFEANGSSYLVARDTNPLTAKYTGLSVDALLAEMRKSKAQKKVLF